jgi:RNA polymerase sigma factor (sigma-70 family)
MKRDWVLTQDGLDALLGWLDSDRNRAGTKYETVRVRLVKIFTCRGCLDAEDLADETINRVVARIDEIAKNYEGDPLPYFYAVSHKVHLEYLRKSNLRRIETAAEDFTDIATPFTPVADEEDSDYTCLERCLEHLSEANRKLVLEYYQHEKQAKIDHRKQLAAKMGIAVNALRIRAHRIRVGLEACVRDCLRQVPAN